MNNTYKTNKTDWRRLGRSILFVALMLGGIATAQAQYVFMHVNGTTYNFLANTNDSYSPIDNVQNNFSYSTCVWTRDGNSRYYNVIGSNTRYLQNSNNSLIKNANVQNNNNYKWTINGNTIYNNNSTSRYIRYNNGWELSTTNSNRNIVYQISGPSTASIGTPSITTATTTFSDLGTVDYNCSAVTYVPAYYTLTPSSGTTYYVVEGGTPSNSAPSSTDGITYSWSLNDGSLDDGHVRINASTGVVEYYNSYATNTTTTIKVTATHTASGTTSNAATKAITFNALPEGDPTGISATDISVPIGSTITAANYTLTTTSGHTPHRHVTATSGDESIATVAQSGDGFTITGVALGTITITINAYRIGNSEVACSTTFTVTVSEPQTGISGDVVTLNDYEDHSWAYYSDPDCPIRSLSPADVKITYYGDGIIMTGDANYTASTASSSYVVPGNSNYVGGAKVNVGGENENTFVYYKTLERGANTQTAWTYSSSNQSSSASRCPYTPIPNPFQVRPTYGGDASSNTADWDGWRGFQCWRLKSVSKGAVYSAASGGSALSAGAVINANTDIYFAPNSEYGMEVEFEAVWARAYVVKASDGGANSIGDHSSLGYERNFIVLNTTNSSYNFGGTSGKRITNIDRQVTVSNYLPNGNKGQNNDATYIRGAANNYNLTLQANTKFENVAFNMGSNTLTAAGNDLIIGRGCTGTVNLARGMSGDASSAVSYTIRLESGTYNTYAAIDNSAHTYSSTISARSVFGCDYDRAKGDNNKLSVAPSSTCYGGNAAHTFSGSGNRNNITYDWLIKSGKVQGNTAVGDAAADKSIYIGNSISSQNANSIQYCGKRRLTMEGGEIASIAGSVNCYGNNYANYGVNDGTWSVMIRLKGGTVRGSIYGAAAYAGASGDRRFIFTGGTVKGWIAGGANGTQSDGGMTYGASQLYVGGNTSVNSNGSTSVINRAVGGNVFGAGCGYGTSSNSGQVTVGTTVVVADDAYIERGVYGGGSYGFTEATANIYLMGGTVDCKVGGVNGTSYLAAIEGGVYGGACQNKAGTNNIKIYGGTVNGGVYGGCNYSGNVANAITVDVYGTDPATQSNPYAIDMVFGGGNLAAYSGTPVVTVHCPTDEATPISIGELYGGGNNASVTGTNVTIGGGNIIGDVYGGGRQAAVGNGGTSVTVNGGTMRRVFGGNNISGTIAGGDTDNKISVTVNKTGTCAMKIGEVFGGGNQADSRVGNITIGCTGTLTDAHRAVGTDDGATPPSAIGYTLEGIGDVYGGANDATVTGNVTLTINSGIIYRVFGANNTGKKVTGTVTVNIAKNGSSSCPDDWYVGYVYGGGNNAPYGTAGTNYPAVSHSAGKVTYNVYGGGKGSTATVTSNPKVILSGTAKVGGNVFGGGNAAPVVGNPTVLLKD